MNKQNMEVLTKVIAAVESGGQVYGNCNYKAYTPPYTNSDKEHTITLGWAQNYGYEAKKLVELIHDINPANFRNIDKQGVIAEKLNHDWVAERWKPTTSQRNILISLIDSAAGHEAQDRLFQDLMKGFIADCGKDYTNDIKAQMMYCEIRHLGGKGPADRIFKRCNGNYSLNNIMASLKKDQDDKSSDNQVGDKKYWSRHEKCREFIDKHATNEILKTTIVDEFSKYIGTTEYNGIVAIIQRWYYGSLVKDAWCATSTSYFANVAGILNQLGGKNEGVWEMMNATKKLHQRDGRFWEYPNIPYQLKKHDIVFFKRNGASHVAHCWRDETYTGSGMINVLGGNQSDMICKKDYRQANIQAVYRPDYGKEEGDTYMFEVKQLRYGDTGKAVKLMQRLLRSLDYRMTDGRPLGLSAQWGVQTDKCLREFQSDNKLTVDGICGPKTWAKLIDI